MDENELTVVFLVSGTISVTIPDANTCNDVNEVMETAKRELDKCEALENLVLNYRAIGGVPVMEEKEEMNLKQREALIELLNSAPYALECYIESETCADEYENFTVLEEQINILEMFSELSEGKEVVNLIKGFIAKIDKVIECGGVGKYQEEMDTIEREIMEDTDSLIWKIENA